MRNRLIDVLRGVSILVVLLFHFDMYYHLETSSLVRFFGAQQISPLLTRNGYYGVTMFFVISGFLMTSISLRRYGQLGKINPAKFYLFRLGRIAPCLALVLTTLVSLHYSGNPFFKLVTKDYSVCTAVISILTFRFNALLIHFGWNLNQWNILWSLSIEETFYLCFPLVCMLLRDVRLIAVLCIMVFFIGPMARFHGAPMEQIYGYFSCFDQIALGCITAISFPLAQEWMKKSRYAVLLPSAGAFILAYGYLCGGWRENIVIGPSLIAIGTALLLLGSECPLPPIMRFLNIGAPLVALFGRKSYEIYLFHTVLLAFMWMASAQMKFNLAVYSVFWLFLFLGLSLAVGYLISRWWSEPMNSAIRRGLARRSVPQGIGDREGAPGGGGVEKESGSQPSQSARGQLDCLETGSVGQIECAQSESSNNDLQSERTRMVRATQLPANQGSI